MVNINALTTEGKSIACLLRRIPDKCPKCNRHGQPDFVTATYLISSQHVGTLHAAFRCPVRECRALYIAEYNYINQTSPMQWEILSTPLNRFLEEQIFPKNIKEISPPFCLTFNQARIAEENKLDQICGPGYRKALEFLVKDYLTNHVYKANAPKQEEVKKAFLSNAIEQHIDEDRIKRCAKRAAWLGNDEVHYARKWEDKDIHDLKSLILMTVSYIDLTIESARYLEEMPA